MEHERQIANYEREMAALKAQLEAEGDPGRRQSLLQRLRHLENEILRVMREESEHLSRANAFMEAHLARLNKKP